MPSICFYFQVHQPYRIKQYSFFDIGRDHAYFENGPIRDMDNAAVMHKVADKCYLPANEMLLDTLRRNPDFKISFSISGTALEQMEAYAPEVVDSFRKLVDTGRVELLDETYYHSLSFFYSNEEFIAQVHKHREKIKELFGVEPQVFRNTELSYNNELAALVEKMGYKGILAEGWEYYLDGKSPNFVYQPKGTKNIKLLLKNYKLSDDIAFRFGNRGWEEYPLDAPKFAQWVDAFNGNGQTINLFMDYETFGEHQWADTGIFDFMRHLPAELLKNPDNDFKTPSEVIQAYAPADTLDLHNVVTWADTERDLSAWTGNEMQRIALKKIYELEEEVVSLEDEELLDVWRKLQTSDHFYYMCTKWFSDGDVHKYFSPYDSPYEAFISYMNVFNDFRLLLAGKKKQLQS